MRAPGSAVISVRRISVFLLLFVALMPLLARQPLVIVPQMGKYPLGLHSDILEDTTGNLTIQDVRSPQLAAGIVHDFKNPITVIKGFLELAEENTTSLEKRHEYMEKISHEADRMSRIAQDLLDFSRGTVTLIMEDVPLSAYLDRVQIVLNPYFAPRQIQFSVGFDQDGVLRIDPDRFLRVFVNIAGNAADLLYANGRFEIRVHQQEGGGIFIFELSDNGPGIPEAIRSTVFEPFVSHGKAHGTGLGMAIARSIVEAHGGSISFETESGRGTTFRIELPA